MAGVSGEYTPADFLLPQNSLDLAHVSGKFVPTAAPSLSGELRMSRWTVRPTLGADTPAAVPIGQQITDFVTANAKYLGLGALALVMMGVVGKRGRK